MADIDVSSVETRGSKASTEIALDLPQVLACEQPSSRPRVGSSGSTWTMPSCDVLRIGGLAITRELDRVGANLSSNTTCHEIRILRNNPCNT